MAEPRRGQAHDNEPSVKGARILIVEARFYDDIADALLRRAPRSVLDEAGAMVDRITVPGSLEIPPAHRDRARRRGAARQAL